MADDRTPPMLYDYKRGMEEIRQRLEFVAMLHNEVAALGTTETTPARLRLETGYLHLRTVLELLAFSSLIAHKDAYASANKDYQRHYKAEKMLDAVEELNPAFYPIPFTLDAANKQFTPIVDGWLTRDDFVELFNCASELVHAGNPYSDKQVFLRLRLDEWVGRIRRLLEWHGVIVLSETERLMVNVPPDLQRPVQVIVAVPFLAAGGT